MKTLGEFGYLAPHSVDEAISLLRKHRDNCRILGGGADLIALVGSRGVITDYVLDIKKIPELRRIEWRSEEGLCVGAACTIADLEASPHV
jgi:CO/xanthine dehydrogenase FAD-binding subunit